MKYLLLISLSVSIHAFAQTGEDIIRQSRASIKNLKSVSFNVYAEEYGEKRTADIIVERSGDYPVFEAARIKLSGIVINDSGSRHLNFASAGNKFEFIDNTTEQVVRLEDPTYPKLSRTGLAPYFLMILPPYFQKEPFENVLKNAKTIENDGDTSIYTISCYKVKVTSEFTNPVAGKITGVATWFIGKKNYLVYGISSKSSRQYIKIRDVDRTYSDETFDLSSFREIKKMTGTEAISDGLLPLNSYAPDWTLPAYPPDSISLRKLKGKVIVLDFWGTWCLPCIKAMPDIQFIHDHFINKAVVIIGVSVETEKTAKPVEFIKSRGYTYPIVLNGKNITDDYRVKTFPAVYIIDKNGMIIHAEYGGNREGFKEDMIKRINKALQ